MGTNATINTKKQIVEEASALLANYMRNCNNFSANWPILTILWCWCRHNSQLLNEK